MIHSLARTAAALCALLAAGCAADPAPPIAPAARWPADVESVLTLAGDNRPQLEAVIEHYRDVGDPQKFEAACFLIRNMPGHGFIITHWVDKDQREVPFDGLAYRSLREAAAAMEKLEATHGRLRWAVKENRQDLHIVEAAALIDHIDRAFKVYRTRPWCRDLSFELFCDYILPYRATNEPLADWRAACEIDADKILARMTDPTSIQQAADAVSALSPYRVGFNDLYYMNPTDQGFDELVKKPVGRCEDQQTMRVYVLRANGIPVAGDFTPFWATRDNNHAWETVLDAKGFGRIGLSHVPAKIYRKTYSRDPQGLAAQVDKDSALPRRLTAAYRDVTEQYVRVRDVTVELAVNPEKPQRFVYACVFNGGEWRIVDWAKTAGTQATFDKMGYGVVYLPVYFDGKDQSPAGPPVSVSPLDGSVRSLAADVLAMDRLRAELVTRFTAPAPAGDLRLLVWTDHWTPLAENISGQQAQEVTAALPENHLYWIVGPRDANSARIFTVERGRVVSW